MGKRIGFFSLKLVLLTFVFLVVSCSSSKTNYKKRYNLVWKELLKSQAWKDALKKDSTPENGVNEEFYASTDDMSVVTDASAIKSSSEVVFKTKYTVLVSRAYAKIIAEAEKADSRLEQEYKNWNKKDAEASHRGDISFKKELATVNKRFYAHREMLEGLKSWNVFSEFGSDDLEFFKNEHISQVRQMFQNGDNDSNVVGFLVYKLADLYHFEN